MKRTNEHKKRRVVLMAVVVTVAMALGAAVEGCGEEECLAWGENCSLKYKQDNYGRTDIQCCSGQCTDHGSGIVTCGA